MFYKKLVQSVDKGGRIYYCSSLCEMCHRRVIRKFFNETKCQLYMRNTLYLDALIFIITVKGLRQDP